MIVLSPDAITDIERVRLFLDQRSPVAAKKAFDLIWSALERVEEFPNLGLPTFNPAIRQIVVRFGSSGYVVRYAILPESGNILVTRIWHGREQRI